MELSDWSDDVFRLCDTVDKGLPNVVRVEEGFLSESDEDQSFSQGDTLHLNCIQEIRYVESRREQDPEMFTELIPVHYNGKVVVIENVGKEFKSVQELMEEMPRFVKTQSDVVAEVIKTQSEVEAEVVKAQLEVVAEVVKTQSEVEAEVVKTQSEVVAEVVKAQSEVEAEVVKTQSEVVAEVVKAQSEVEAEVVKTQSEVVAEVVKAQSEVEAEVVKTQSEVVAEVVKTQSEVVAEVVKTQSEVVTKVVPNSPPNSSIIHNGVKMEVLENHLGRGIKCRFGDRVMMVGNKQNAKFTLLEDNFEYNVSDVVERRRLPVVVEFVHGSEEFLSNDIKDCVRNYKNFTGRYVLNSLVTKKVVIGHFKPTNRRAMSFYPYDMRTAFILPHDSRAMKEIEVREPVYIDRPYEKPLVSNFEAFGLQINPVCGNILFLFENIRIKTKTELENSSEDESPPELPKRSPPSSLKNSNNGDVYEVIDNPANKAENVSSRGQNDEQSKDSKDEVVYQDIDQNADESDYGFLKVQSYEKSKDGGTLKVSEEKKKSKQQRKRDSKDEVVYQDIDHNGDESDYGFLKVQSYEKSKDGGTLKVSEEKKKSKQQRKRDSKDEVFYQDIEHNADEWGYDFLQVQSDKNSDDGGTLNVLRDKKKSKQQRKRSILRSMSLPSLSNLKASGVFTTSTFRQKPGGLEKSKAEERSLWKSIGGIKKRILKKFSSTGSESQQTDETSDEIEHHQTIHQKKHHQTENHQTVTHQGSHQTETHQKGPHQTETHQTVAHQTSHQMEIHQKEPHQIENHQIENHQTVTHQGSHQTETHKKMPHQSETHQTVAQQTSHQMETHQKEPHQTETYETDTHQTKTHQTETHQTDTHQMSHQTEISHADPVYKNMRRGRGSIYSPREYKAKMTCKELARRLRLHEFSEEADICEKNKLDDWIFLTSEDDELIRYFSLSLTQIFLIRKVCEGWEPAQLLSLPPNNEISKIML